MCRLPTHRPLRRPDVRPRAHVSRRWTDGTSCRERAGLAVLLVLVAACATKLPPPLPSAPKYAEFLYPAIPQPLQNSPAAPAIDRGWRYLQNDDLGSAAQEFAGALKRTPGFYPARAGEGYVALAQRDYRKAVTTFDAALSADRRYVPALVGRGQALLGLNRGDEALAAFEQALAVNDALPDVRRRVELLQFRNVQDLIERARTAAGQGRFDESRMAYERAIAASPESAFLYRELGSVEHRQGDRDRALEHLRKAVELEPADTTALIEIGGLLEERQDYDGALASYRRAAELDASPELAARITAVETRGRDARLPAPFRSIAQSPQITRGELAALIGVRLEPLLRPVRQVVMTDLRDHWAAPWITTVVNAGVMDAFDNHTFQPQTRVRRADLAGAVSRAVALIAPREPALRQQMAQRPQVADVSATHLDYPAVAVAVSTGVLPLSDGRFQVSRPVSGQEAVDAVARLQALAQIR